MYNASHHSYHLVQAMRFAVEEISNSSSLLPNVTLGYEIYDTCCLSATIYATLSLLSQGGDGCCSNRYLTVAANYTFYVPKAVAAIGPDTSENAIMTASLLGIFRMPQVSYEASSPTLSNKHIFPSFLRTIPSDCLQVDAMVRLLETFKWIWVAVVGSDNDYGRQGLQMLHEAATRREICFAYQGIIPTNKNVGSTELAKTVLDVVDSTAKVVIVFANKRNALPFFQEVVRQNVTGKVWLGTEDWSLATEIWQIHGIRGIGTVIGIAIKQTHLLGMKEFEAAFAGSEKAGAHLEHRDGSTSCLDCRQPCSQLRSGFRRPLDRQEPSPYDTQGAFSVYSAVYSVAHSLHHLLGCQTGVCHKGTVYPWQLLKEVKRVNFSLKHSQVYFDTNGDPLAGYNLVLWKWAGEDWDYTVVGSFDRNPDCLSISEDKLLWHTEANQVPVSVCSKECEVGEQKVQQGMHRCCFHCVGCSPGTFLNKSDVYTCQKCRADQWAPARSETCFDRTTVFLPWNDYISLALLVATTLLLLLVAGTAAVFVRSLHTPVVRSAGGWMCFTMLGSLACASSSLYFFFGVPGRLSCLVRLPVYTVSFCVCLSCMAARSTQIVIIFKMASRSPGLYEAWRRYHGPGLLIGAIAGLLSTLVLISVSTSPPVPHKNYNAFESLIVLECSQGNTVFWMIYNGLLGIACFTISYMGKDLPNSYNEAKCITFSLLIYFASFTVYSTTLGLYRGKYLTAVHITTLLSTLFGIFGSYFAPKAYIVVFRPELNTNQHFQLSIQSYTKKINAAD
ncbi:taste receptor type 1 member 1 [Rhineura floridana]|uniref:taste receptor type 1 member 1 n=1 Tax=Rhineura floridana TaxID=261503 RepID=UPI002AC8335B|nr:taste receptor type 1 member 1 [Rhineura floridana]